MIQMAEDKYVYIIVAGDQQQEPFYLDREVARTAFRKIRNELATRVQFDVDELDRLEFTIGWEERKGVWKIVAKRVV